MFVKGYEFKICAIYKYDYDYYYYYNYYVNLFVG